MSSSASSPAKMLDEQKNQPSTTRENCCPSPGKSSEKELIPNLKSTDQFYRYLEKSKPTQLMVINFTTEWCEPCKKAKGPFEKCSKLYEDVKFAKVDVDVDVLMNIAKELGVTMMPTFLLVKVKKLVKKDGVQGDHEEKKAPPVLNRRYKMVKLDQLVGWNDEKQGELCKMIEKHRYTTT